MMFATLVLSLLSIASALPTPNPDRSSVFRVLASNANAAAAMPQGPPPLPLLHNSTMFEPASSSQQVMFDACPVANGASSPAGVVHDITVSPCSRSSPSEPCHFHAGQNYTIDIHYTSYLQAEQPRSGLSARDDSTDPSSSYPYSGQTFGGCSYTDCPVQAGKTSLYRYEFETLLSPFDYLTFNLTQSVDGPSLFCAGFAAKYTEDKAKKGDKGTFDGTGDANDNDEGVKSVKKGPPKNPKKARDEDSGPEERRL
ncbi:uncharacterized protein JCM15063_001285 [Sporobolomyces koalae]|uniref:uncharacterized protein n=1 Tax=Sporobolomyces koalae TaxID=500713 RepID=UPI00317850B3